MLFCGGITLHGRRTNGVASEMSGINFSKGGLMEAVNEWHHNYLLWASNLSGGGRNEYKPEGGRSRNKP